MSRTAICSQILPPSGVTHSAAAALLPQDLRSQLVLIKGTLLEIYHVGPDGNLTILLEKTLYGVAESLAVLKGDREASSVDALMITFRDAKLSVMQWDVASHDLVCSSLHYYEGNKYSKAGWEVFASGPLAVADPQGRCGAVLFYRHLLAVLPTMESEAQLYGITEDTSHNYQKLNTTTTTTTTTTSSSAANFANGYVDNLASAGIKEVRDAIFLHGYNEPVLLVLHEVEATWTGIYSEKKDTCALTALSLNLSAKRHPKIWGATKLPSDAYALVACPSSGGALVLCQGMVLYYEQGQQAGIVLSQAALPSGDGALPPLEFDMSQPPEKVAGEYANKHVRDVHPAAVSECIKFCDKSMAESNLECDAARATWLNDNTALLCLKHGQLLLLLLEKRGGSVTIKVAKAGSAPPPSTACSLASDLIFLGSIAGDSLVVKLSLAVDGDANDGSDTKQQPPPSKRQKTDTYDEDDDMDEEEMFVYGMEDDDAGYGAMPSYKMSVADTLLNHGPINDIIIGKHDEGDPLSSSSSSLSQYILTCSGRGKQGCLIQMNQSVMPDIITSVPLPGVSDIWAVHASLSNPLHSYLLMSFSTTNTTKVLATGDELQEVTDSMTFASDTATLYAATLKDTHDNGGVFIIQAYSQGIRLVSPPSQPAGADGSSTLKQEIIAEKELGSKIAHVDAMDAYVLVLLDTKIAVIFQLFNGMLSEIIRVNHTDRPVEACCLYRDTAGWVSPQNSILMVVADGHDTLEIHALPTNESVWKCHGAAQGKGVLHHSDSTSGSDSGGFYIVDVNMTSFPAPSDMRSDLGKPMTIAPCSLPVVVALTSDGRLLAYRAISSSSLAMMSRIYLSNMPPRLSNSIVSKRRRITSFHALGEHIPYSGFFIACDTPFWLIAHRGRLLAQPHHHQGFTSGFTSFHNVNCPWGFITAESQQEISIAQFRSKTRFDAPLPRMKIALKATPLRIAYYPEAHLYALLVSKQVPYVPHLPEEEGGEVQASYSYALADAAAKSSGIMQQGEVRLVQPGSWNTVWQHALLPGEKALSIAAVHLKDTTTNETVPFIAVGAGFLAGEDYPCSGRLILFKVRKNTTTTKQGWIGEVAYSREFKGPVTSIAEVDGSLVISTGNRIETCIMSSSKITVDEKDDDDDDDVGKAAGGDDIKVAYRLIRSAFHDGPILITSMQAIKSYILAGDVHHSVQFIQCTNEGKQLQYLGKDFSKVEVDAVQFLISKSALSLVVADKSGTLRMLVYDRRNPESWGGDRLLPCGLFHIGEMVECMTRVQLAQISKDDSTVRQAVLYGTSNGCIGMLAPLAVSGEGGEVCEKLLQAQEALNRGLVHIGGLNPAAFRRRFGKIPAGAGGIVEWGKPVPLHGVLDGELLGRMEEMTVEELGELGKGGVDVEGVVGAMMEMKKASVLF